MITKETLEHIRATTLYYFNAGNHAALGKIVQTLERLTKWVRSEWYEAIRPTLRFPPFPTNHDGTLRKYKVVYADPPWFYNDRRNTHTRFCGGAMVHYPTMRTEEICALPVRDSLDDDAYLFLWATWPNIQEAFHVMEAWGFRYVTLGFVWVKTNKNQHCDNCGRGKPFFGIGAYAKSNTEICILGVRGKPSRKSNSVSQHIEEFEDADNLIEADRAAHSVKPVSVREAIEKLCGPHINKLEMFCREPQPGWDAWGLDLISDRAGIPFETIIELPEDTPITRTVYPKW